MLSLALPPRCVHCELPTAFSQSREEDASGLSKYLCATCLRMIQHPQVPEESAIRSQLRRTAPDLEFEHLRAASIFNARLPIRSVIHYFKYMGMPKLAERIGSSMKDLVPPETQVVIPVPLHRTRLAHRGYNQALLLAKGLGFELAERTVKRSRPTSTQTKLHIEERIENVRGAFSLTLRAKELAGKHVLLIDDVLTTGATFASLAETVLQAYPASISILALAVAEEDSKVNKQKSPPLLADSSKVESQ